MAEMTAEERAAQLVQDESIATLAMVCGREWMRERVLDEGRDTLRVAQTNEEMAVLQGYMGRIRALESHSTVEEKRHE